MVLSVCCAYFFVPYPTSQPANQPASQTVSPFWFSISHTRWLTFGQSNSCHNSFYFVFLFFLFPSCHMGFFVIIYCPKFEFMLILEQTIRLSSCFVFFVFVSIVNACFYFASFARIRKHCWDRDPGKCSNRKSMCICMDCSFVWRTVNKSKRYINTDFHKGQQIFEYFFLLVFVSFFSRFVVSVCLLVPNKITTNKK